MTLRAVPNRLLSFARTRRGWAALLGEEGGATAVEYGLIVAGIATSILWVTFAVGESVADVFLGLQQELANRY